MAGNETAQVARIRPAFTTRRDLPIAVVVGAGGTSMAIAQRLGQGHKKIVLVSLGADELEQGEARLHELGVISTTIVCDITDPPSVGNLGSTVASLGQVRAVAHVAALSPSMGDWRSVLNVNLVGAARVEQIMHPMMASGGAAVFISSLAAHGNEFEHSLLSILDAPLAEEFFPRLEAATQARVPGLAYSFSKVGVNRMVRRRAWDWGRHGCRIVSLSPGLIDTVMGATEDIRSNRETKARLRERRPLGRDGTMAEIADAVEFLISPRASYVTGTDLLVDGGLSAAMQFPT